MADKKWFKVDLAKIVKDTVWVQAEYTEDAVNEALAKANADAMGEYDSIELVNVQRHGVTPPPEALLTTKQLNEIKAKAFDEGVRAGFDAGDAGQEEFPRNPYAKKGKRS